LAAAMSVGRIAKRTGICWLRPRFEFGQDQYDIHIFKRDRDGGTLVPTVM